MILIDSGRKIPGKKSDPDRPKIPTSKIYWKIRHPWINEHSPLITLAILFVFRSINFTTFFLSTENFSWRLDLSTFSKLHFPHLFPFSSFYDDRKIVFWISKGILMTFCSLTFEWEWLLIILFRFLKYFF